MEITWLGWAGVELAADDGATLVIDALEDAGAVWRPLGGEPGPVPAVVAATPGAVAGLVTHLHRDHTDPDALQAAVAPDGVVLEPPSAAGWRPPHAEDGTPALDDLALWQTDLELTATGRRRQAVAPWTTVTAGPFSITALPAVDGVGDPQVSWLVEADGVRVLHCGDTMWHAWWWRFARFHGPIDVAFLPACGARLNFPHRQPTSPYPAVLDPEQAAAAAGIVRAGLTVPMHAEGYDRDGVYTPTPDAASRFVALARDHGLDVHVPALGEPFAAPTAAAAA